MQLQGNWNYPTSIRFGAGRAAELPALCRELGMRRPLLVTDPGLARLPMLARLQALLSDAGLETALFSDMRPNPVGRDVDAGVAAFRDGRHDGVVAVGGGSALDVGKAIALMSGQKRPLWDFEDVGDNWLRVDPAGVAPTLAVPTTAGTGSEVGRASLIIDEAAHRKVIIFHPAMLPKLVLADPELTVGLPPALTAATGVDALVHNLEAFCSPFYHPIAQGVALEGMRLAHDWLPAAHADGGNLEARAQMLSCSIMGATAFQKGLGGVHALAHPIGAVFDTHHGLANAVLLPYVLVRNRPAIAERLAAAARYLGLADADFDGFLAWVLQLRAGLGIPHTLAEIGIGADAAADIGRMAKADPSDGGNPLPLSADDYRAIFLAAQQGRL
ncbi:iron-containing alcohol dehydrogenase [Chromobacterium haemolyticum]|uniref:Iron-containing alcohol dehydrogenase n=1 Tax=Chromobacterium haemolyticum TaxID=394935 RepID=A0ABS3GHK9_9NEIS|nr:iron-containing alcohol dehydrogenase [Chromobacterium haemolyticum]MBK0413425.1 iron-containing alcohol dehydrogenase [Chromobacterium haemolyticum]MBO0414527.1 iron-containing alcohol dehydrogenase [Chromobacterium haemolyticum]MBO0497614.1 iron-containing alcohol dehydrogenase [Chromobacterium haemolyticum]OQS40270.1 alcohol dehydrogenase [Chromobacterium haemolyticum]PTU70466.1 alcohol dehydrogenase [Chromobacterium haemolyticum]